MYVYSSYHDAFFERPGSVRDVIESKAALALVINRYIPLDDVRDIHYGAEAEVEGVYAIEVWIELENGETSLVLADSPIPLEPRQWQKIINELDREYKRIIGLILDTKNLKEPFENIIDWTKAEAEKLGEKVTFIAETTSDNLEYIAKLVRLKPWQITLIIQENSKLKLYVIPRKLSKNLIKKWSKKVKTVVSH